MALSGAGTDKPSSSSPLSALVDWFEQTCVVVILLVAGAMTPEASRPEVPSRAPPKKVGKKFVCPCVDP